MKELFVECYEEILSELIAQGVPEAKAEDIAALEAYERMRDRYADLTDRAYSKNK